MAKDSLNVVDNGEVVIYFPPEAHVSEIMSSSVDSILNQTDTHYILRMKNDSVKSMNKSIFEATS